MDSLSIAPLNSENFDISSLPLSTDDLNFPIHHTAFDSNFNRLSKGLCRDITAYESHLHSSTKFSIPFTSSSCSSKLDLTGSLVTPAELNSGHQRLYMSSADKKVNSNPLKSAKAAPLYATRSPHSFLSHALVTSENDLKSIDFNQSKSSPSTSGSQKHERAQCSNSAISAKYRNEFGYYSKETTNTVYSYSSKSELHQPFLSSPSGSTVLSGVSDMYRPKSLYRRHLVKSHFKSTKSAMVASVEDSGLQLDKQTFPKCKPSEGSMADFCIVNYQFASADSNFKATKNSLLSRKLKPVLNDVTTKSHLKISKQRNDGLNKLNLLIKSSSLCSSNTSGALKPIVNSSSTSSLCKLSGGSSSCSFCFECSSDCICKCSMSSPTHEKNVSDMKSQPQRKSIPSFEVQNYQDEKSVRSLTSTKKHKKKQIRHSEASKVKSNQLNVVLGKLELASISSESKAKTIACNSTAMNLPPTLIESTR